MIPGSSYLIIACTIHIFVKAKSSWPSGSQYFVNLIVCLKHIAVRSHNCSSILWNMCSSGYSIGLVLLHFKNAGIKMMCDLYMFVHVHVVIRKLWMLKRRGRPQHQSMDQSHASMSIRKRCSTHVNNRLCVVTLSHTPLSCRRRTFGSHLSICLRKKKNFQWLRSRSHVIDAMGMLTL